uniref:RT_RNaseH_2 domain-containing protein n=1 Tax=Ascaris lumbricoides TaxID=6252 RepID=A0A0M3HNA0_ASCLU
MDAEATWSVQEKELCDCLRRHHPNVSFSSSNFDTKLQILLSERDEFEFQNAGRKVGRDTYELICYTAYRPCEV